MRGGQSIAFTRPAALARPSLLASLLAVEVLLVGLHFATHPLATHAGALGHRLSVLFNLDAEQSVGTWFSSSQLLLTGLVLWLAAAGLRAPDQPAPWLLRLAAAGFLFLSLDEAAAIHEAISRAVFNVAPAMAPFGHKHSAWIALYGVSAVLLLALFWPQVVRFRRAFPAASALGAVGAAVVLAGAIGLESLFYVNLVTGHLQVALEEALEMAGGSLMLCAALAVKDASAPRG